MLSDDELIKQILDYLRHNRDWTISGVAKHFNIDSNKARNILYRIIQEA